VITGGFNELMETLTKFFKGHDTKFGIFYPTDYLVAIFPDMATAVRAEHALGFANCREEDVIAVPGPEVIRFYDEHLNDTGLLQLLMQQLSRLFATEEVYLDHDVKLARQGAAFLAVYTPTEDCMNQAWAAIEPLKPIAARRYALGGVHHLAGEL
jgi:hypothetical protein